MRKEKDSSTRRKFIKEVTLGVSGAAGAGLLDTRESSAAAAAGGVTLEVLNPIA